MGVWNIATVFSGIGAFEHALKKLNIEYKIVFACDNGERTIDKSKEEITNYIKKHKLDDNKINEYIKHLYSFAKHDNFVKKSYMANYEISENCWYEDIRFLNSKRFNNKVDILVGGSPCQSFSTIGKHGGLEDARGTLFYEFARLIKEIQPKVFIYENVPGMLRHDKGKTWETIKNIFNSLGYKYFINVLNAKDYGIPQSRKRLFVVGFRNKKVNFSFPKTINLDKTMFDYLEDNPDPNLYLQKKGFEFVTNPKYKNRARVNREIIQTEKANQQFNWNGDFVFESLNKIKDNDLIMKRAYIGKFNNQLGAIRLLSPRECLNLMGFNKKFKIVVPRVQAYRQSGNSIVVNVIQEIIKEIVKSKAL